MKKKKVNPRRRPVSQADVTKARKDTVNDALKLSIAIFFTVMVDKHGYTAEELKPIWHEVNDLSDGVSKGYVNLDDLQQTLKDEYDIELS